MSNKILFPFIAVSLCLVSCVQESRLSSDSAAVVRTVLNASLPELGKTSIDGVKVCWSSGDEICVNGSRSYPLSEPSSYASFSFEDVLSLPYSAVYPASLWKNSSTVTLPSSWNPALQQIPLRAYSESEGEVSFSAFTAVIRLLVSGSAASIEKVELSALGGEQLSGDFSINYATGELTPLSGENAGSVLTLNCDIALGDTPAEIYVPVPPGTYQSGFKVDFTDSEGNVLSRQTGPRTLAAGQLRAMPEVHWSVNGIASAADFADFASAVNSGASTAQWEDSNGVVNLLSDIDFTGVDSWTPAGLAVVVWASNKLSVASGHPFEGKFNGRGHSIKNFNFSYSASDASATKSSNGSVACGIFGCLAPGAVVENLVIDGSCSFKFSPQVRSDAGIVAGLVNEAAVRNITNYAPMELDNKAEDDVRQTMSIVGFAFADAGESVIEFIENRGDVSANCGQNIKNGATGVMISGILGFGTNDAASKTCVNVSHCVNYGELNSNAARSSGIVSASNRYTIIEWCDNHGNNYNSFPTSGGGRIANITCITGLGSSIRNCTNYADAICSTKARTGGIVSLINNASCSFVGVANYGRIITDETTYRGTIFQQCNFAATFSGCIGGGDVGTYNGGSYQMVGLNSGNYFNYVGYHNAAAVNVTADNIVYGDAPEWKGISSAEDLQALAQTVNSGGDVSPFMSGGKIQILCDINASSIKDWVPIGTESHPFSYTLDGMGHCIRNFNWTVDAVNYKHAGLIGYASDAKICNLVFGNPGSSITFNGNAAKLRAGAIVGYAYAVTMENVTNNATLQVSGSQAYGNALIIGGLAGYSSGESFIGGESSASACVNNGNILVPLVCQQAGLVGYNSGQVKNCVNNGAVLGKLDGSQYGPAWGCSYNRKKTYFVNNSGYGHVGDYDEFLSNPAAAPADNYYNAVRQEYETYFDPESNEVDMTLDSYYDWTKQSSLNLGAGVKYTHYTFDNVPRHMHVLEMDLSNPSLEIVAALADDIIPNPNGRDNEHLNAGFYYRETLSRLCSRKRSAGEKILAGANMGYFDSEAGILRGFHVQEGVPLYINNPAVVSRLQNHRWGFAVFADGTATCGVKTFSGKLRTGGVEYDYHSVNDTTLRKSWPGHSPVNLFTSHYVKVPHSGLSSVTNGLSANVLYVICEYDSSPMKVNCGYAPATVKAIYDGRSKALTSLPYITQSNRIGIALSGSVADTWASSVKVGDTIEFRCDIAMDGDASKPILSLGSSMFMPLNAGEDGTSSIPSGYSMHTVYDPVTFPVVSQDGRKVWLVEIDGRQGWYSMGVRVYEVYRIGRKLGGWSLTRFDGGGSACMWVWNPSTSKGGLVNKPSDSKGERSCMSYILIRSK